MILNSRYADFLNRTKIKQSFNYGLFPESFVLSVPNAVNSIFINCSFERLNASYSKFYLVNGLILDGIISLSHGITTFMNCKFKEICALQTSY